MNRPYFLYAEDDEDDIDILQEMLYKQPTPSRMVSVSNGFALLDYLQHVSRQEAYPCLIILDMQLPKLNGMQTLELLRTDDLYRLIPVVIFSSRLSGNEIERCEALGAEVLIKPLTYTEWLDVLDRLSAYIDGEETL